MRIIMNHSSATPPLIPGFMLPVTAMPVHLLEDAPREAPPCGRRASDPVEDIGLSSSNAHFVDAYFDVGSKCLRSLGLGRSASSVLVRLASNDPFFGPGLNWCGYVPCIYCMNALHLYYIYRNGKLVTLDNKLKSLETSIAYVSTLGGGYFLCRFPAEARKCAAAQLKRTCMFVSVCCALCIGCCSCCAVAIEVGDLRVVSRTVLHFVYLDIQEGFFSRASRTMKQLLQFATETGDTGLTQLVRTAALHLSRVKDVAAGRVDATFASETEDPLYRHRLLRNSPDAAVLASGGPGPVVQKRQRK